ncbi:ribosomal-protein-alanine N-acetyltransferase/ribosomal-protein-serine acetyltransferase [Actinocorallia herbida]|uniref:Ribosomal-protein-alanine N-acetyltransferase/ribosomal-protein-serine acetyltransferase n=1 Tax=Actinocorallia herbida TaxID=58109 RepID=A0A3N1CSW9_9ACTN|nr:ribosomal-protein-alanine N-acetyltransferase/ribosomal-protein-serine acetyltransferase [Actinocorallia herbida]
MVRDLGDGVGMVLRGPELAEEYHRVLLGNRARLLRWDPGAMPDPLTVAKVRERMARDAFEALTGVRVPVAIVVRDGEGWRIAGGASLRLGRRGTGEIGYWVDAAVEGRGVACRAVSALLEYGFTELGLRQVRLSTDAGNHRSRALARRLGFTPEHRAPAEADRTGEIAYTLAAGHWRRPG